MPRRNRASRPEIQWQAADCRNMVDIPSEPWLHRARCHPEAATFLSCLGWGEYVIGGASCISHQVTAGVSMRARHNRFLLPCPSHWWSCGYSLDASIRRNGPLKSKLGTSQESFPLVVDKSTLDAFFCNDQHALAIAEFVKEGFGFACGKAPQRSKDYKPGLKLQGYFCCRSVPGYHYQNQISRCKLLSVARAQEARLSVLSTVSRRHIESPRLVEPLSPSACTARPRCAACGVAFGSWLGGRIVHKTVEAFTVCGHGISRRRNETKTSPATQVLPWLQHRAFRWTVQAAVNGCGVCRLKVAACRSPACNL